MLGEHGHGHLLRPMHEMHNFHSHGGGHHGGGYGGGGGILIQKKILIERKYVFSIIVVNPTFTKSNLFGTKSCLA